MERLMFADPKSDFAFKRIFGAEDHPRVLIAFLNAMLELEAERRIVSVRMLPPEQRPLVPELKLSIADVRCRDARGVTYVVEMQVLMVEGFEKRVVYNVAKSYVSQLKAGDNYPRLNDVVGITICDFEVWPETGQQIPMLSRWHMTEAQSGVRGLGQIRHVFLELPKYDASRPPLTDIEKWAFFFREAKELPAVPAFFSESHFEEAFEAARIAQFTVEDWDRYMLGRLAVMDQRGMIAAAKSDGHHLGLAQGEVIGERRGEKRGEARGEARGLRKAIEIVCRYLSIELTDARRLELDRLDAPSLSSLLARLEAEKCWG